MQMEDQKERVKISSKRVRVWEDLKPYGLCIFSSICFAGFNLVSKASLDKGMSPYVLVVYAHAFGTLSTALLALLASLNTLKLNSSKIYIVFMLNFVSNLNLSIGRKNESKKIDGPVLRNVFLLGLLGGVLGRTLYYMGLQYTSPAFASAMCNIIPSTTFIIAVLWRVEKFDITKLGTQAKTSGTLTAFAGATLMTIYKGTSVISIHNGGSHQASSSATKPSIERDWIKGSIILVLSCCSLSAFYILQTITIKMYPAPITMTSLTCLSGTFLSAIMAAILDHKPSCWKLSWDATLLAPLYSGIVIFGVVTYVQTVVLQTRGPVFATAFKPLDAIIVAVIGVFVSAEAIYLGSILGASLIILGLYATLWGKFKEKEKDSTVEDAISEQEATEIKLEK